MKAPFFSIIIPVYNGVTMGLSRCLDSIWSQPLDGTLYEVICVDDCSTDDTREWLRGQERLHANLRVFENEKNIRQGGGRNHGLKVSAGRYVIFIDQDDYFHCDAIKRVYSYLRDSTLQILIVDSTYEYPGFVGTKLQHDFPHREIMTGDEQIERNGIPYAPWKFIFLRSLVTENNLYFVENERIEDVDWVHRLVHYADRTQYQPILFIHYIKHLNSTTMSSYSTPITAYSTLRLAERMYNLTFSDFKESSTGVRAKINDACSSYYHYGVWSFLFFHDSVKFKAAQIRRTRTAAVRRAGRLVRLAYGMPALFSALSNYCVPFTRIALYCYRKAKYINRKTLKD